MSIIPAVLKATSIEYMRIEFNLPSVYERIIYTNTISSVKSIREPLYCVEFQGQLNMV